MGVYTIDDFTKKQKETGVNLSDADLRLAQTNPDAGMSIINYKNDYAKAATDAQRQAAHAGAESVRNSYGYSGGAKGANYYQQNLKPTYNSQNIKPTYNSQYDDQMNSLFDKLMNREAFSYDAAADPMYQQYKDLYIGQGRQAMQDTMGQAAALTGGYGSSYAQNVGQQAYDSYLQKLNEVMPELYGQAYQMYQQEGNDLLNQYGLLADRENQAYGRYQDLLNQYYQDENMAYGRYQDQLNQYYARQDADYQRAATEYDKLVNLITTTGYNPSDAEMANANMSSAQKQAYLNYYQQQLAAAGGSGGSGGGSGRKKSSGGGDNTAKDYYVDKNTGKVNNVKNRSLSFSPDEGIFTWEGKNYNSVDKLVAAWNKTNLSDNDEKVLRSKFKSQTGKDLSDYGY